jgi:hypothetical protein
MSYGKIGIPVFSPIFLLLTEIYFIKSTPKLVLLLIFMSSKINLVTRQLGEVVAVSWKPPPNGWHKVNVDGSFNTISGSIACDGLIRNQHEFL